MTAHDDIQTVREVLEHCECPMWAVGDTDLARAALDRLVARLERAEQELRFTHDRGDHLVYRREWEEFDRWQRWRDDERKEQERYQPTAQEFNDAMEGR
jgi:hypothetical protein